MSIPATARGRRISLGQLHLGQSKAHWALQPHRFKALRCGRRFGKTEFAKTWIAQGLVQGEECAWFAPQHMTWSEVYLDLTQMLQPILNSSSRTPPVIRLSNGGRIDFWSLENAIAGRGRRYQRVVIDEAAFTKDGDNRSDDSMMALWEKGIKPTLFDYGGAALVCSNSAGRNPDNFFYNICIDLQYGFREFHATTLDNPLLPKRAANESVEARRARKARFHEDLRKDNDPLVYAQEYMAEFVDWSGVAFFSRGKLLVDNKPLPLPGRCDAVFAVIDTASKTGTDNDATAVTFFAYDTLGKISLFILDWDVVQIKGRCWKPGCLRSSLASKNLFSCVVPAAARSARSLRTRTRGQFSCSKHCDDKCPPIDPSSPRWVRTSERFRCPVMSIASWSSTRIVPSRRRSSTSDTRENHLLDQVESFRVGDRDGDREDDLLDTFCYGVALALGNSEGF